MLRRIALLIVFTSLSTTAQPRKTIHWLYSEMPPAHILQGEHKKQGYADLTLQLLIDSLPEYEHIKVVANYKRSLMEMSAHDNRCHSALLKTSDREAYVAFSVPTYVVSPNKLFVHRSKGSIIQGYLTEDQKVDLARLLANERFVLGVSSGAKYGDAIDQTLSLPSSQDNLVFRSAFDHYSGLSGMLQKKQRLDGFLGLSVENVFFQGPDAALNKELLSFAIDGVDEHLLGYVGCSKSELGSQVIEAINNVLLLERANKIKRYYQRWLMAKDRVSHETLVNKIF